MPVEGAAFGGFGQASPSQPSRPHPGPCGLLEDMGRNREHVGLGREDVVPPLHPVVGRAVLVVEEEVQVPWKGHMGGISGADM